MSSGASRSGNGRAPHWGDLVERWACENLPLERVDETAHDALLEDGTRVQIKGAQAWVSNGYENGEPSRCRGRFKFWKVDQEQLELGGGRYLLVVYTTDSDGSINVLESDWFSVDDVAGEIGDDWYSEGDPRERSKGLIYRTTWSSFFPELAEAIE